MAKYKKDDIVYTVGFASITKIRIKCVHEFFENGELKKLFYESYDSGCNIMENELFDSEEAARQHIIDNISVNDKSEISIHEKEAKNYV
jgi:hypothetical protein